MVEEKAKLVTPAVAAAIAAKKAVVDVVVEEVVEECGGGGNRGGEEVVDRGHAWERREGRSSNRRTPANLEENIDRGVTTFFSLWKIRG